MLTSRLKLFAGITVLLLLPSLSWASGATFEIRAVGITLGEAKEAIEDEKDLIRITTKAQVGKPFTLMAQGMALPRGGKAEPIKPDSGKWSYDEKAFKTLKPAQKEDPTIVPLAVEASTPGTFRFRFEGKVLGYPKIVVVVVEVGK